MRNAERALFFTFGVGATLGVGRFLESKQDETAASATTSVPAVTVEVAPTTQPNQLPGTGNTAPSPTLAEPTTTVSQFAIVYEASHIACRGIMDGVIDGEADKIVVGDVITWSSLRAMERIAPGDNGYARIEPAQRAETFAAEVMSKSGVTLTDVNVTPPGTAFQFGTECIDQFSGQPLAVAFPPKSE